MLRIAVPNKGSLSEPAAEMLHEAGYRQRKDSPRTGPGRPGQRGRVLLPPPARHRGLRRLRPARRRHHRPRPAARLRRRRRGDPAARLRRAPPSASPPGRHRGRTSRTSAVCGSPPPTRAWSTQHLAEHGVDADGGPARRRGRDRDPARASPTSSPTSWRPVPRCATPGWRSSASRSWTSEAVLIRPHRAPARTTPRSSSSCAGCRASSSPAATC